MESIDLNSTEKFLLGLSDMISVECSCKTYKNIESVFYCRKCSIIYCKSCSFKRVSSYFCSNCYAHPSNVDPCLQNIRCTCSKCPVCDQPTMFQPNFDNIKSSIVCRNCHWFISYQKIHSDDKTDKVSFTDIFQKHVIFFDNLLLNSTRYNLPRDSYSSRSSSLDIRSDTNSGLEKILVEGSKYLNYNLAHPFVSIALSKEQFISAEIPTFSDMVKNTTNEEDAEDDDFDEAKSVSSNNSMNSCSLIREHREKLRSRLAKMITASGKPLLTETYQEYISSIVKNKDAMLIPFKSIFGSVENQHISIDRLKPIPQLMSTKTSYQCGLCCSFLLKPCLIPQQCEFLVSQFLKQNLPYIGNVSLEIISGTEMSITFEIYNMTCSIFTVSLSVPIGVESIVETVEVNSLQEKSMPIHTDGAETDSSSHFKSSKSGDRKPHPAIFIMTVLTSEPIEKETSLEFPVILNVSAEEQNSGTKERAINYRILLDF